MRRRIIKIDTEKCNGCGLCAKACHEGAIAMIDGKAALMRDDYCDGLGDCLPACPTGAISFEVREAEAYDQAAVERRMGKQSSCAGAQSQAITNPASGSALMQWPVQIQLAPIQAPYYQGARLLIAADCTAYAYHEFHTAFMQGRITLIGCPKLDDAPYEEKLCAIFQQNDIKDITLVRMEVPCCGGMDRIIQQALADSGKQIPYRVETIALDGTWQ
ncbi:MAG: 4Fe-4S binding protein [Clostridiales bacterium]|nr:4Fe-4S binding protein [Clostridiales bacterium]